MPPGFVVARSADARSLSHLCINRSVHQSGVQREFYAESNVSVLLMQAYFALRATTNSGRVEAGCCATLMRRAAPWPETSSSALCAMEDKSSRHVRRVASRLPSPPLAPVTKRRLRGARKRPLRGLHELFPNSRFWTSKSEHPRITFRAVFAEQRRFRVPRRRLSNSGLPDPFGFRAIS